MLKALSMPANYMNFGYSTDTASPRTDNIFAMNGSAIAGTVVRIADSSMQIFAVKTQAGYNAYGATKGALPVKLNNGSGNFCTVTEKYVDLAGNPLYGMSDSLALVNKGDPYGKDIPTLTGYTTMGYFIGANFDGTYTSGQSVPSFDVSGNTTVYFVYQNKNSAEAVITKILKLPIGTNTPDATFKFSSSKVSVDDSSDPSDLASMPSLNSGSLAITFTPADRDSSSPVDNIMTVIKESGDILSGVVFQHAGIYIYEITENDHTNSAIDSNIDNESLTYSGGK